MHKVSVIGGGLAGSEAAWQLANRGIEVTLYEMRGVKSTPAHHTDKFAELVCSNSFRSDDVENAVGLLHEEMRRLGSLIMRSAGRHRVPAGSALAVDRELFADEVSQALAGHPLITIVREEVVALEDMGYVIVASGPLTSDALSAEIIRLTDGQEHLAFFDAIAPIVYHETIDFNVAWMQSRYDKGEGKDYINCPLSREQYYDLIDALLAGEKTEFKEWERDTPYFNGCLPIEVMAERGRDTLRFGPMKPVGLTNPYSEERPYAVVQLRQDNKLGSLYNMVGFQTKLKWGVQKEIFQRIPGLENAEFARLGGLHRNTFINSPLLLDRELRLKRHPQIRFAGQITGVEGYLESAAIGLISGLYTAAEMMGEVLAPLPEVSALGALVHHITGSADSKTFQPMNINYGLFPKIEGLRRDQNKKALYSERALAALDDWRHQNIKIAA